jgi:hypothetical protein
VLYADEAHLHIHVEYYHLRPWMPDPNFPDQWADFADVLQDESGAMDAPPGGIANGPDLEFFVVKYHVPEGIMNIWQDGNLFVKMGGCRNLSIEFGCFDRACSATLILGQGGKLQENHWVNLQAHMYLVRRLVPAPPRRFHNHDPLYPKPRTRDCAEYDDERDELDALGMEVGLQSP